MSRDLYQHEVRFIKELSDVRVRCMIKEEQKDFLQWVLHYQEYLEELFYLVRIDFNISFDDFTILAYQCTDKRFNLKKFKYTRPLV